MNGHRRKGGAGGRGTEDEPAGGSLPDYKNRMNEMDLLGIDYDSENNHSSLSSIHREIAPVAEMGIGIGSMCNFPGAQNKVHAYDQNVRE